MVSAIADVCGSALCGVCGASAVCVCVGWNEVVELCVCVWGVCVGGVGLCEDCVGGLCVWS